MTLTDDLLTSPQVGFPDHIVASCPSLKNIVLTKFSRRGNYLAAGARDGSLWCLATHSFSPLLQLVGHTASITSLSFSADAKYLVSGSSNGVVLLWDLITSQALHQFQFSYPLIQVTFFPNNDRRLIAITQHQEPTLIELTSTEPKFIPLKISDQTIETLDVEAQRWCDQLFDFSAAGFDHKSRYLFLGTATGLLAVYDVKASQFCHIEHLARSTITQILCHPNGQDVLLNCKTQLKLFELTEEPSRPGFRSISRIPAEGEWQQCTFSPNGNWIVVCSARDQLHQLQVWEREGERHSTLLGPGRGAQGVEWHPTTPSLLSIESGILLLWEPSHQQKWSGFEPKFIELTTNEIVQEEESAYDLPYASPSHAKHPPKAPQPEPVKPNLASDDSEVDVLNDSDPVEISITPNLDSNPNPLPTLIRVTFNTDPTGVTPPDATIITKPDLVTQSPLPPDPLSHLPVPTTLTKGPSPHVSPSPYPNHSPGFPGRGNPASHLNRHGLSPEGNRFHFRRSPSWSPRRNYSPRFAPRRYPRSPSYPEPFTTPFRGGDYYDNDSVGSPRNSATTTPYSRQGPYPPHSHPNPHHRPDFDYDLDPNYPHPRDRDNFDPPTGFDPRREEFPPNRDHFDLRRDEFDNRRDHLDPRRNPFHSRRDHFDPRLDSRMDGFDARRDDFEGRRDRFHPNSPPPYDSPFHSEDPYHPSYRRGPPSRHDHFRRRGGHGRGGLPFTPPRPHPNRWARRRPSRSPRRPEFTPAPNTTTTPHRPEFTPTNTTTTTTPHPVPSTEPPVIPGSPPPPPPRSSSPPRQSQPDPLPSAGEVEEGEICE